MNYVIYRAINKVNGKSYIGFTKDYPRRKKEHLSGIGNCRLFKRAIEKYGQQNFQWEKIYESKDRVFAQEIMEPFCIRLYKSYCKEHGYNLSFGGEGSLGVSHFGPANPFFGKKHTEETKAKIRLKKQGRIQTAKEKINQIRAQTGHLVSPETRRRLSAANKGHVPWSKGRALTEEHKRKIAETERKTKAKIKEAKCGDLCAAA